MAVAFVAISYMEFRAYTIEDCVNYAYGLNRLIAADMDIDSINDYIDQGHAHPDYDRIERHLSMLRDAYPDIVYLYVYQIREDGCHVVFDLDTDDVPAGEQGEIVPFDKAFLKYVPDLLMGNPVEPVISRNEYGFLLTIYTPLYDSWGMCHCYAAVDYSMDLLMDYVLSIHMADRAAVFDRGVDHRRGQRAGDGQGHRQAHEAPGEPRLPGYADGASKPRRLY